MKKELVVKQSSEIALEKTKTLIDITRRILTHRNTLEVIDKNWMYKLWAWADENNIDNKKIPREIGQLTQLTTL
jgi:hypothetical protein